MASLTFTTSAVTEAKDTRHKAWMMPSTYSGHKPKPPPSFWSQLCNHCRSQSICREVSRDLPPQIAWNSHGPVKAHWIECLFPIVLQYLQTNRKQICGCQAWNGSIDCYMVAPVGGKPLFSRPCIVVTCLVEKSRKRLIGMLQKDSAIAQSGFEVIGRSGNLRFKMKDDDNAGKTRPDPLQSGSERRFFMACGLPITDRPIGLEGSMPYEATVGGLLLVGSHTVALTVAHVLPKGEGKKVNQHHRAEHNLELFDDDSSSESLEESDEDTEASHSGLLEHDCATLSTDPCCFVRGEEDLRLNLWQLGEGKPAVGRIYDWALLQTRMSNTNSTYWGHSRLEIKRLALHDPEDEQVLVLSKIDNPTRAYCSGTPSLIACGPFIGLAYEIRASDGGGRLQAGISGSWVINQVSGDLYGVIVAGSSSDEQAYMVRASDVFADIARTCGVAPTLPQKATNEATTTQRKVDLSTLSTDAELRALFNDIPTERDEARPQAIHNDRKRPADWMDTSSNVAAELEEVKSLASQLYHPKVWTLPPSEEASKISRRRV